MRPQVGEHCVKDTTEEEWVMHLSEVPSQNITECGMTSYTIH